MNNGNNLVIKAIHKLTSKALNRKLIFQTWVFTMSSYPMLISATSTFSKIERYKVKNNNTHTHTQREREREREREPEKPQQAARLVIVALNAPVYPKA
jgi:hypothetical protein